jgi:hypothetical protein
MELSRLFTPCRVVTVLIVVSVSIIIIFQNQLTTILKALPSRSCGRVEFERNKQYSPHTFPTVTPLEDLGPGGDEAWKSLTTARGGFLWLQYNETYDMPWGISMFHGIHCLQMLRGEFQSQLGMSNGGGHHHHTAIQQENHGSNAHTVHLGHCLGYIAEVRSTLVALSFDLANQDQMLQCVGDSTIERPWIKVDELTGYITDHGVDGGGIQHQCRDINHLWTVAEKTEEKAAPMWDHKPGDTIEFVFGDL